MKNESNEIAKTPRKKNTSSKSPFSQEEIDAVLLYGSVMHEGKYRIYTQFLKNESSKSNADFLRNEYGCGGASPISVKYMLGAAFDSKGITIRSERRDAPQIEFTLNWTSAEKRIKELICEGRYLSEKEMANYPAYCFRQECARQRNDIAREFRSIIYDFEKYVELSGEKSEFIEHYLLCSCWSSFAHGSTTTGARKRGGEDILPIMREAMRLIIARNTHLTERCEAMLKILNSEAERLCKPFPNELAETA